MKPGPIGISQVWFGLPSEEEAKREAWRQRRIEDNRNNRRPHAVVTGSSPADEPPRRKSRSNNPFSFAWADLPGLDDD